MTALAASGVRSGDGPPAGGAAPETVTGEVDRAAWDALVRRHHRSVVLSLLALGLPFDEADDVARAAWARLFEQHGAGRLGELRLPGLAIVQARFLALSARRRARAERDRIDPRGAEVARAVEAAGDPEQRLLSREQAAAALAAVASAPETQQRVFALLYGEPPRTPAEAASVLGLSVQRVRQVHCELRKRVRAALGGDES